MRITHILEEVYDSDILFMQREKRIFRHMILTRDQRMVMTYELSYLSYSMKFNTSRNCVLLNIRVSKHIQILHNDFPNKMI